MSVKRDSRGNLRPLRARLTPAQRDARYDRITARAEVTLRPRIISALGRFAGRNAERN